MKRYFNFDSLRFQNCEQRQYWKVGKHPATCSVSSCVNYIFINTWMEAPNASKRAVMTNFTTKVNKYWIRTIRNQRWNCFWLEWYFSIWWNLSPSQTSLYIICSNAFEAFKTIRDFAWIGDLNRKLKTKTKID